VTSRLLLQVTQDLAKLSVGGQFSPQDPEPFRAQRAFVHVNILWFLSLCLSLGCGLFATLVQQWLRRYMRLTQHSSDPIIRVRIRMFLFTGIHKFNVRWVAENISLLLHAAIFLFFAGLVEFLFAFNDEVAIVISVVVFVFAVLYTSLTFLPVRYHKCPYQTPLTTTLWYTGHILYIAFLYPVKFSSHVRDRIGELRKHCRKGPEKQLMGLMKNDVKLDKDVLETTLGMCRDDNELEGFMDAIPGYLQMERDIDPHIEPGVAARISNIKSLLSGPGKKETGKESESRPHHRLVNFFASCTSDHRRMDGDARRRRAIVCSRTIWEMSRGFLSIKAKDATLDLPISIGHTLHRLTGDTDSEIAASALRAHAMFKRAHTKQPADAGAEAHKEKDYDHSNDVTLGLPKVVGTMMSSPPLTPSPSYQVEQRDDMPSDEWLKTVTEYTSGILDLIPHLEKPSHMDLEETEMTFEALCREPQGRKFSLDVQKRLADVLSQASDLRSAPGNAGMLCTNLSFKF
jgi:hypothetical protein